MLEDSFGMPPLKSHRTFGARAFRFESSEFKQNKKAPTNAETFSFWLGWEGTLALLEDSFGMPPLKSHRTFGARAFRFESSEFKQNKKAPTNVETFSFWLGWEDSNRRDARVKVWCLTTWLQPNIKLCIWGERWDSNPRPPGPQPGALTN